MIQNQWHFYNFFSYLAFRHYAEAQATCESHAFILKIYTCVVFLEVEACKSPLSFSPLPKVLFFSLLKLF